MSGLRGAFASACAIDRDKHKAGVQAEIRGTAFIQEEVQGRAQLLNGMNVDKSKTTPHS